MHYRTISRSAVRVSEIGLGCEGLLGKSESFVHDALNMMEEFGANCIDLYSPNPDMRTFLGRGLRGRRDKFILQAHLSTIWQDGQYKRTRNMDEVREGFEDQLTRLQTDYVDIGMIHYVDALQDWDSIYTGDILRYALELKKKGVIRSLGLSSHNPQVAHKAVLTGLIDVLLFSINPCYDLQPANEDVEQLWNKEKYASMLLNMDPERMALYECCQRERVGITVMKAFGGGDLLHADRSLAGVALTPYQCIHYALDRPGVVSVLTGAHSLEELRENLNYANATEEEKDYAKVMASFPRMSWKGHCMYCGHCAPCPSGIDVATVTKFLHLAEAQGSIPETVREHYAALPHTASECIQCGSCEDRCPFSVASMQNMEKAATLFGK